MRRTKRKAKPYMRPSQHLISFKLTMMIQHETRTTCKQYEYVRVNLAKTPYNLRKMCDEQIARKILSGISKEVDRFVEEWDCCIVLLINNPVIPWRTLFDLVMADGLSERAFVDIDNLVFMSNGGMIVTPNNDMASTVVFRKGDTGQWNWHPRPAYDVYDSASNDKSREVMNECRKDHEKTLDALDLMQGGDAITALSYSALKDLMALLARSHGIVQDELHKKDEEMSAEVDTKLPESYCCPISKAVMQNPVQASDGHTYDNASMVQWLSTCDRDPGGHAKSPLAGGPLPNNKLIPNHWAKGLISQDRQTRLDKAKEEDRRDTDEEYTRNPPFWREDVSPCSDIRSTMLGKYDEAMQLTRRGASPGY